jgi:hypothetical protein
MYNKFEVSIGPESCLLAGKTGSGLIAVGLWGKDCHPVKAVRRITTGQGGFNLTEMIKRKLSVIQGRIVAIQEERFRLISPEGQGYLLTLSKPAAEQIGELKSWHRSGTQVEVQFTGEPNLESGIAVAIWPL